jgi:tetratricopeptide (TPR) repeat protein
MEDKQLSLSRFFRSKPVRVVDPPTTASSALIAQLFVDRTNEIAALSSFAQGSQGVAAVHGPSGSGKTWLLERIARDAHDRPASFISSEDRKPANTVGLLNAVASELRATGSTPAAYDHKYARYLDALLKAGKESRGALGPWLKEAAGTNSLATDPSFTEHITGFLRTILPPDQVQLLLAPEARLSAAFMSDWQLARLRPATLCIDDIDAITGDARLLGGLFEALASHCNLLVSYQVRPTWIDDVPNARQTHALEALDPADQLTAVQLHAAHIGLNLTTDECLQIVEFSMGYPLAIRLAAELKAAHPTHELSSVEPEIGVRIASAALGERPQQEQAVFQVSAVPRHLNSAVLHSILPLDGDIDPDVLLKGSPFCVVTAGEYRLLPLIRDSLDLMLRQSDRAKWEAVTAALVVYYERLFEQATALGDESRQVRADAAVEWVYHASNLSEEAGITALATASTRLLQYSELDATSALLSEARGTWSDPWSRSTYAYLGGDLAFRQGRWSEAETHLRLATGPLGAGNPFFAQACVTLGRLKYAQGAYDQAQTWLAQGVDDAGELALEGYAEEQLAKVKRMRGELELALELHRRAIDKSKRADASYALASNLGSYGTTLLMRGRLDEGRLRLQESVNRSARAGYVQFECTGSRSLSWGHYLVGEFEEAKMAAKHAVELASRLGDTYNGAFAGYLMLAAEASLSPGHVVQSMDLWKSHIETLHALGASVDEANARLTLSRELTSVGDYDLARTHQALAETIHTSCDFIYGSAWCLLVRAETELAAGPETADTARQLAMRAAELSSTIGAELLLARSRDLIGEV